MDDIALKILMLIIGTAISVGIGTMIWRIRKSDGKDDEREKRREEREVAMREEFIEMKTEFKRMKEDWKDKNVDKAYDIAFKGHERIDDLKNRIKALEE